MTSAPLAPVQYRVDANERIVWVNDAWNDFARENGYHRHVIGTQLWDHIADSATRQIYSVILDRVRASLGPVSVPFRCDSPTAERRMVLTIDSTAGTEVRFTALTQSVRAHGPVQLIDAAVERTEGLLLMCGWCKRVHMGDWIDVVTAARKFSLFDSAALPSLSHGICDTCSAELAKDFG